jgi:hypothetical protein
MHCSTGSYALNLKEGVPLTTGTQWRANTTAMASITDGARTLDGELVQDGRGVTSFLKDTAAVEGKVPGFELTSSSDRGRTDCSTAGLKVTR